MVVDADRGAAGARTAEGARRGRRGRRGRRSSQATGSQHRAAAATLSHSDRLHLRWVHPVLHPLSASSLQRQLVALLVVRTQQTVRFLSRAESARGRAAGGAKRTLSLTSTMRRLLSLLPLQPSSLLLVVRAWLPLVTRVNVRQLTWLLMCVGAWNGVPSLLWLWLWRGRLDGQRTPDLVMTNRGEGDEIRA